MARRAVRRGQKRPILTPSLRSGQALTLAPSPLWGEGRGEGKFVSRRRFSAEACPEPCPERSPEPAACTELVEVKG
jgi:hypothetical protein